MKKIRFIEHILPHLIAIGVFLIVTVFFFNPVFFENKTLEQPDIQEFKGSAKSIMDYREETGEEALWADGMFSGMPAYLISVQWGNTPITFIKKILSLGLTHPFSNIFLAFLCYYIMLLSFRIRPYLAIAGAIAFGLSSYMIIGLGAGHNGRIGAIAFMPLVMAGIHLAFSGNRILGSSVTAAGIALHLRENHIQITYYLMLIILVYGLVRMIEAIKNKTLPDLFKNTGMVTAGVVIGALTFFGQFWAINEYSAYSTRGKSDLAGATPQQSSDDALGMSKEYAFEFSNSILEPLTLLLPNIYGGSSGNFLFLDKKSETYNALVKANNPEMANKLVNYTSAYWGEQRLASPYYAGAIIVFLFAVGIAFADKKYVRWLVPLSILGIVLSWGSNFASFNYMMFDYFPGYKNFRSVTFTLIIILFAMPLLGFLGLEKICQSGLDKKGKQKLLIAFASTGGLCILFWMFAGMFSFTRGAEAQFPAWFVDALADDRKSLLRSDALRSFAFIFAAFIVIYFELQKKISPMAFYAFLIFMITVDLAIVDKRYFTNDNFKRKRDNTTLTINEADQQILKDKSRYRVYNLSYLTGAGQNPFAEARTSYFHNSIGGYHGAKMRRYAEFYDSCMTKETQAFITQANQGNISFVDMHVFNMLNIKYILLGTKGGDVMPNTSANGNAWFVNEVVKVNSPAEELAKTCSLNTRITAVIDASKVKVSATSYDSSGTIKLIDNNPKYLKYESKSSQKGLAVFSEIYYPKGWVATIDGKETNIIAADYILRALEIPAGNHTIEFKFQPKAYTVGNKVTKASSWVVMIFLLGSIVMIFREPKTSMT